MEASSRGDMEAARKAFDDGANANNIHASATPLLIAAEKGHAGMVDFLLDRGAKLDAVDTSGNTALAGAAANGHQEIVRILLRRGANVNTEDVDGWDSLRWAVEHGHLDTARSLIDAGADVHHRDAEGTSIVIASVTTNARSLVELLVQRGAKLMPANQRDASDPRNPSTGNVFTSAASSGALDALEFLVKATRPSPRRTGMLNAALHIASDNGKIDVVRFLIEQGLVDIQCLMNHSMTGVTRLGKLGEDSGYTALSRAVCGGHDNVARLLLEKGARVVGRTNPGEPLLTFAILHQRTEFVRLFLERKPRIDAVGLDDRTALMAAAEVGDLPTTKTLLARKASVSRQDRNGRTALHHAALHGHTEIIAALLAAGASVSVKDSEGHLPGFYAERGEHAASAQLLSKDDKSPR